MPDDGAVTIRDEQGQLATVCPTCGALLHSANEILEHRCGVIVGTDAVSVEGC